MKELDAVKLKKEFKGLPIGTEGMIVLEYDGTTYEVDFFIPRGRQLMSLQLPLT